MIRWSYGYRYLLAPESEDEEDEDVESQDSSEIREHYHQTTDLDENAPLIRFADSAIVSSQHSRRTSRSDFPTDYEYSTAATSVIISNGIPTSSPHSLLTAEDLDEEDDIISFPPPLPHRRRPLYQRVKRFILFMWQEFVEFMNMPLWAMLVAVAVALFPTLQHYLFFEKDGFIRGSVIYAIQTCGDVSIPLILVILGANLANEDPPIHEESQTDPVTDRNYTKVGSDHISN